MKVVNSDEIRNHTERKTAAALGSFDALHKGHLKVIGEAVDFAKKNGLLSLVQLVEMPNQSERVKTLEKRLEILNNMGVDIVVIEEFTQEFKTVEYADFVADYIRDIYNAKAVFAGENRFGHGAKGDTQKLIQECAKYGIEVFIQSCVESGGIISSSRIRQLVKSGQVQDVAELMIVPYSVSGEVVHGEGIGKNLGFPTANINIPRNTVVPKDGVYISKVLFDGKEFLGITNVGSKPTVDINDKNIETYIAYYNGNLYGKTIEVQFLKYLREIKKFDSLQELKRQLQKDKENIKK